MNSNFINLYQVNQLCGYNKQVQMQVQNGYNNQMQVQNGYNNQMQVQNVNGYNNQMQVQNVNGYNNQMQVHSQNKQNSQVGNVFIQIQSTVIQQTPSQKQDSNNFSPYFSACGLKKRI